MLCDIAGVSRSGFYSWKKRKSFISEKEEQDRKDFELILEAYKFKGADNILNRHFEDYGPGYVLETDITYLFYGHKRFKAYLSVIKDGFTKQILAYVLSLSLEEDFVLETINQLYSKHKHNIHTDALIHSD